MIGIFDSGCGGLTVVRALRERLPSADILYFGDIKNAPYGEKSQLELLQLTGDALSLLQRHKVTSIISACNSVSTSLALSLLDTLSIAPDSLLEMVGPTAHALSGRKGRIGLLATQATVESGIYQNAFRMRGMQVEAIAVPELAGAIEAGKSGEEIDQIIASALTGKETSFEVVVLACTHYPLVRERFQRFFPNAELYDPATAVAERAAEVWNAKESGIGISRFLISKKSAVFRRLVAETVPEGSYSIEVIE